MVLKGFEKHRSSWWSLASFSVCACTSSNGVLYRVDTRCIMSVFRGCIVPTLVFMSHHDVVVLADMVKGMFEFGVAVNLVLIGILQVATHKVNQGNRPHLHYMALFHFVWHRRNRIRSRWQQLKQHLFLVTTIMKTSSTQQQVTISYEVKDRMTLLIFSNHLLSASQILSIATPYSFIFPPAKELAESLLKLRLYCEEEKWDKKSKSNAKYW